MPIYEYLATKGPGCSHCQQPFEVVQAMTAAPLQQCPECGAAVTRLFSSPSIHGQGSSKQQLSNKNLAAKGFTKYVKRGDGYYEKSAGKGPKAIKG